MRPPKSSTIPPHSFTFFIPFSLFDLESRFFAPPHGYWKPARAGTVKAGRGSRQLSPKAGMAASFPRSLGCYSFVENGRRAMKILRRRFLELAVGVTAFPAATRIAIAQIYPTRPVRIIVGQAGGSSSDITARLVAQRVSERLGQQFIIEVRPGAGGNIATEAAVAAPADGYTILLVNAQNTINSALYEKLSFNFLRDIAPVVGIDSVPLVMEVHPSFPAKTVPEFIAYAKANPGKINMASAGIGGPQHVAGELFKFMAGVNLVHVPYRGSTPALTDLMAGQVQVMFDVTPS